jgi:Flp pilus assembly protein TadG
MSKRSPARSSSRSRLHRRDARGSVSIELVILLPALFAVMFLGMQAALFYHARTVAIAAAQEGARAAGAEQGHEADGVGAANDFIAEAGGDDVLTATSATARRATTTATVTVTGFSLSVIPGWKVRITQSATVPVERLTSPTASEAP